MPIINQIVKGSGGSAPAPAHYIEKTVDANSKLINGSVNIINLNGVTDIGSYVLAYAYCQTSFPANTSADLSGLTTISGSYACYNMFQSCTGLTSVDLSGLTTMSSIYACGAMFAYTRLTSADLSDLTTISGANACNSMFNSCIDLTSVDLSSLTTISGASGCYSMFNGCTGLTSVDMSSLTTVSGNSACGTMFQGCTSLATVYIGGTTAIDFGTQTSQFGNMFRNCTQNIDVYAPAANQTAIEAFSGYPNFGGTGTVTWHWRS